MGKIASLIGRTRSIPQIRAGLEALGYDVVLKPSTQPGLEDILVIWNRLPTVDEEAQHYEGRGCKVVVCEHGWIGKDTYAVALNQHNGAGRWHIGAESRWPVFGIATKPWRVEGDQIVIVPQRGMGTPPVAMPRNWTETTLKRLKELTRRPLIVRNPKFRHESIEPVFKGAHAVVTWASGAGVKAIVAGCPVFYEMPMWIGAKAASPLNWSDLDKPYLGDRSEMLHDLSWAMWTEEEMATGEPFRCVLQ